MQLFYIMLFWTLRHFILDPLFLPSTDGSKLHLYPHVPWGRDVAASFQTLRRYTHTLRHSKNVCAGIKNKCLLNTK